MSLQKILNIGRISKLFSRNYNNARYTTIATKDDKRNIYYKERGYKQEEENIRPANWDQGKPYKDIPGPKPLPEVGSSWLLTSGKYKNADLLKTQQMLFEDYGKIVALKNLPGMNDKIYLSSADDVECVIRNEGIWPIRNTIDSIKYYKTVLRKDVFLDTPGLGVTSGEQWFKFRTKMNPILNQSRIINQYVEALDSVSLDFLKNIQTFQKNHPQGEMPIDFEDELNNFSFESLMYVALDTRVGALNAEPGEEIKKLMNSSLSILKYSLKLDVIPIALRIKDPNWNTFVQHMDNITYSAIKHIDAANDSINNRRENIELGNKIKSMLERFLEVDRNVAVTMALEIISGGFETTSKTLAGGLYYLSTHKRAQAKLREELVKLMPTPDTPITKEILENAPYLKATIKEMHRIAPTSISLFRNTVKDTVIGGYQIPKGVDIVAANFIMTHSEEYFPNSYEFRPERFIRKINDEFSFKNTNPFTYMPFGVGPRSCIGKLIANLVMEVGVAKIARNFHLDWPHEDMNFGTEMIYGIADPLRIRMTPVQE